MRIEGISETTDADLVTEAVAGDPAAFAHLVRRHAPMAKRMAVFWGAGADSDDVVQEAFVKAYAALPPISQRRRVPAMAALHRPQRDPKSLPGPHSTGSS